MKLAVIAFVLALSLVVRTGGATAEPININIWSGGRYDELRDLANTWERIADGKVKVSIIPGPTFLDESRAIQEMTRGGFVQGALLSDAGLYSVAREVLALQMPLMFRSGEELACVREQIRPTLDGTLAEKGFKLLTWIDAGWVYLFSKSPVSRPQDLRGKQATVPGYYTATATDASTMSVLRALGANVVPPFLYTESDQDWGPLAIEAVVTTLESKSETFPYMTDVQWAPRVLGGLVITTHAWEEIPGDLRLELVAAAEMLNDSFRALVLLDLQEQMIALMRQAELIEAVPAGVLTEWERQARMGYYHILDRLVPAAMVAEVERLRDECRGSQ
jgi:TRAP-type C4-dicarboxylate transport system substrate-binding protein